MSNKDKKFTDFENSIVALKAFTKMMNNGNLYGMFDGTHNEPKEVYPYERLGDGYELRPIEILTEDGQFNVENRNKYSHLYHNALKVSDEIFRKGGIGGKFENGYCSLIRYTLDKPHTEKLDGFNSGTHVIVNHLGDICIESTGLDYPYHLSWHIASIGNYLYDLRNGKAIAPKSSTIIEGKKYIIIEHKYDWYNKEVQLPLGIYKINTKTVTITYLDEIK
jgi:hypothetical protein